MYWAGVDGGDEGDGWGGCGPVHWEYRPGEQQDLLGYYFQTRHQPGQGAEAGEATTLAGEQLPRGDQGCRLGSQSRLEVRRVEKRRASPSWVSAGEEGTLARVTGLGWVEERGIVGV